MGFEPILGLIGLEQDAWKVRSVRDLKARS